MFWSFLTIIPYNLLISKATYVKHIEICKAPQSLKCSVPFLFKMMPLSASGQDWALIFIWGLWLCTTHSFTIPLVLSSSHFWWHCLASCSSCSFPPACLHFLLISFSMSALPGSTTLQEVGRECVWCNIISGHIVFITRGVMAHRWGHIWILGPEMCEHVGSYDQRVLWCDTDKIHDYYIPWYDTNKIHDKILYSVP